MPESKSIYDVYFEAGESEGEYVASLANKVNEIITSLKSVGIVK